MLHHLRHGFCLFLSMNLFFKNGLFILLFVLSFSVSAQAETAQSSDLITNPQMNFSPEIEISVVEVKDAKLKKLILGWVQDIEVSTTHEGVQKTTSSLLSIGPDVFETSFSRWQSKLEHFASKNWDTYCDCPSNLTYDTQKAFGDSLSSVPDILASALANEASRRFDSEEELIGIPLFFVSPFLNNTETELTDLQKTVALSSIVVVGATAGAIYLSSETIDFSETVYIPTNSDRVESFGIIIGGENLGLNSSNPHFQLGTSFRFNNDASLSLTGGASRVTSSSATGKESISFNLYLPTFNTDRSFQDLSIFGSASTIHEGPLSEGDFIGGTFNGGVHYTITPHFNLERRPGLSNFDLNIGIVPFQFSGDTMIDPETGRPGRQIASSSVDVSVGHQVDLPNSQVRFNASANTGLLYQVDGETSPLYGANFSLTITPRRR